MVETITPVVHGGRRKWLRILSYHVLGAVAAAGFVGAVAGAAGRVLGAPWGPAGAWMVACLAGIYLLREAGIRVPLPQASRQVPEHWRRTMPAGVASFLYGLMLGTGYLTHLGHGTWLVVGATALTGGSPLLGAAVAAPFGLARGVVLAVSAGTHRPEDASRLIDRLEGFSRTGVERAVNALVLGGLAAAVVVGSIPLTRVAAPALALVFAWAAVSKMLLPQRWDRTLSGYDLPDSVRPLVRWAVPLGELGIPVLVVAGRPRAAAAGALVLLAAFSLALFRASRTRGGTLPCGCFGGRGSRDYRILLARNAGLAAVALITLAARHGPPAISGVRLPGSEEMLPAWLALTGVALALVLVRRSVRMLTRSWR